MVGLYDFDLLFPLNDGLSVDDSAWNMEDNLSSFGLCDRDFVGAFALLPQPQINLMDEVLEVRAVDFDQDDHRSVGLDEVGFVGLVVGLAIDEDVDDAVRDDDGGNDVRRPFRLHHCPVRLN